MNKYHAKPTIVDNVRFASAREASRYKELCLLLHSGAITNLELQPRYPLRVNGVLVCHYIADFRYTDADGREHVEDAKGVRTRTYILKRKLMLACHGIHVEEV